jgi:sugar lactone lactonase YvrE
VAQYAGEGHAHAIDALLADLRDEHRTKGTLQPGDSPYVAPPAPEGDLRFPATAVALPGGSVLVTDAGHGEVVELGSTAGSAGTGGDVVRRLGPFREPNGLCLLPPEVAVRVGYDVVVAETAGHRLRGIALESGEITTLAGDGTQWMQGDGTSRLSSPWDVAWHDGLVWVAMAGIHQLWTFDPLTGETRVAAGTTNEGLLDGPLDEAWLAQTSGLAPDGDRLWLVDSETSSLRYVHGGQDAPGGLRVATAVGRGLFDFGFVDGPAADALLQHPLGVAVLPDGSVAVADTYNGAVRRYDPETDSVSTLATGLAEPSGLLVDGEQLVVVESAAHRLTRVPLGSSARASGAARSTQRPVTDVAPGAVELVVSFEPPPGQKVDDRFGPPSQLLVEATPPGLLKGGDGRGPDLARTVTIDAAVGSGVLHVAARAASCDEGGGEGAACHMHQQDWGVPVRVVAGGATRLVLPLSGRS